MTDGARPRSQILQTGNETGGDYGGTQVDLAQGNLFGCRQGNENGPHYSLLLSQAFPQRCRATVVWAELV
jgi:hypothetical protein